MKAISLAGLVAIGLLATTGFALADDPSGTWRLDNGKVTVKVRAVRQRICANIVGLKEPTYKDGTAKIDKYNKNPAAAQPPADGPERA